MEPSQFTSVMRTAATRFAPYAGGVLATGVAGIVVVPAYARALGPAGFGTLEILLALTAVGQAILMLGSETSFGTLVHRSDANRRARLVRSGLRIAWAGGVVWTVVGLGIVMSMGLGPAAMLGVVAAALSAPLAFALVALRHLGRGRAFLAASAAQATATVALGLIAVLVLQRGVMGAVLGLAAGIVMGLTVALNALRTEIASPGVGSEVRHLLVLGLPAVGMSAGLWVLGYSDRFLLVLLASASEVGIYGAAWKVAVGVSLAVTAFLLAWIPFALRAQARTGAWHLHSAAFTAYLASGACVIVFTATFSPVALHLLAGPDFADGSPLVWILVAAVVLYGATGMLSVPLQASGQSLHLGWTALAGAGVKVVATLGLARAFGAHGAAYATLAGYAVLAAAQLYAGRTVKVTDGYKHGGVALAVAGTAGWMLTELPITAPVRIVAGTFMTLVLAVVALGYLRRIPINRLR